MPPPLTKGEQTVLAQLVAGGSNKEIARRLGLEPTTIKNHLTTIYAKLGVRSRTQAVVRAVARGLVALPPGE